MRRLGEGSAGYRGVSDVVGIALLFGIVIIGAVIVVTFGGQAVQDVEEQNRMQVAEQSMREVASRLEQLKSGIGDDTTSFQLPDNTEGDVRMLNRTRVNMTSNVNAVSGACTTGNVSVGTIQYENTQGQTVGYEAGGVFRSWPGGGATVVSPPSLTYRDGRLQLSLSNFAGAMGSNREITGRVNRTQSQNMSSYLVQSLLSNATVAELRNGNAGNIGYNCGGPGLTNLTVQIHNSPYARAWHQFATRNFDERRVEVTPSRGHVESGGTVTMYFLMGDASNPDFVVEDIQAPDTVSNDDSVPIDVTIRNVGGLSGTRDVSLGLFNNDNSPPTPTGLNLVEGDVTLEPNETTTVSFTIDASDTDNGGGFSDMREYRYSIDTEDSVTNRTFLVGHQNREPSNFRITSVSAPDSAELDGNPTYTATIENSMPTGGCPAATPCTMPDTQTVTFSFDGTVETSQRVDLDPGQSTTVSFAIPTREEGTGFPLEVATEDDSDTSQTIDIGDPAIFEITSTTGPVNPNVGDSFTIDATIENTGNLEGTQNIEFAVFDDTGTVVDSVTIGDDPSEDTTLTSGETQTYSVTMNDANEITAAGSYTYSVVTDDDTTNQLPFYVGDDPTPNFVVTTVTASPDPVLTNETLQIDTNVTNVGGRSDTQDVEYYFNGSRVHTDPATLDPDDSFQPIIQPEVDMSDYSPGTYTVEVRTENTSATTRVTLYENSSSSDGFDYDAEDTTITVQGDYLVHLQVIGTEVTAFYEWYGRYYERRAWTEMDIITRNESAGQVTIPVLGPNVDINAPEYQEDQETRDERFNYTFSVENGTSLSVFAEYYNCNAYEDNPRYNERISGIWIFKRSCRDRGTLDTAVNSEDNPSNLLILGDGDRIPAYEAGVLPQRSIRDMLGPLTDPDTERLDLEPGQRILLYELTHPSASPDEADDIGGVDYNDAVVLFEVLRETRTITRDRGSARLQIENTSAPSQADIGDHETMSVNVTNIGSEPFANDTHVRLLVDGREHDTQVFGGDIGSDQTHEFSFDIPTTNGDMPTGVAAPPGAYNLTVQIVNSTNQTAQRNIYIGSTPQEYFLPNLDSYTETIRPSNSIVIDSIIENVGGSAGTQNVELQLLSSDAGVTVTDSMPQVDSVSLAAGASTTETYTLDPDGTGTLNFRVATANATTDFDVEVDRPNFTFNCVLLGTDCVGGQTAVASTGLSQVALLVENDAAIDGQRDIEMAIDEGDDGTVDYTVAPTSVLNPVQLNAGENERLEFAWPDDDPAVYTYNITATNPSTGEVTTYQTGTIQIVDDPGLTASNDSPSSDLISVDMNMIVVGGG